MRDVHCTEQQLDLLVPISELTATQRAALTRWLWDHDITPATLAIGYPIERDPLMNTLTWCEQRPDGSVVKRWRLAPMRSASASAWPGPFPPALARTANETGEDRASNG